MAESLKWIGVLKIYPSAGQVKLNIENTIDNAPNAIILLNLMDNAYDKEFKKINTTNEDYPQKLRQHSQMKEWNNKLKDLIMNLTYSMRSPNESTLTIIEQLKSLLNLENGVSTGEARNINNKLAFEDIFIPYEPNSEYSENTLLEGHVEKCNEDIININYEVDILEENKDIKEEIIEEILEKESNIANDICEDCKQLQNDQETDNQSELQKKVENNIDNLIKVNNKIEKIVVKEESISEKLKKKIRQISISLFDLYISLKNKQKAKIIREIYKLKVAFDSARKKDGNKPLESEVYSKNKKWIMPCHGEIVGEYGEPRSDHTHNGIDIAVPVGTPVHAVADGTVVVVGPSSGYGYWVGINHGLVNGVKVSSEYGHLSSWNVHVGQKIKQGQIIAKSGNTGHSEGPHVHFTIRIGNPGRGGGQAVNPWDYIDRSKY